MLLLIGSKVAGVFVLAHEGRHAAQTCLNVLGYDRCKITVRRTVHDDGGLQVVDDTEFDEEYEELGEHTRELISWCWSCISGGGRG